MAVTQQDLVGQPAEAEAVEVSMTVQEELVVVVVEVLVTQDQMLVVRQTKRPHILHQAEHELSTDMLDKVVVVHTILMVVVEVLGAVVIVVLPINETLLILVHLESLVPLLVAEAVVTKTIQVLLAAVQAQVMAGPVKPQVKQQQHRIQDQEVVEEVHTICPEVLVLQDGLVFAM